MYRPTSTSDAHPTQMTTNQNSTTHAATHRTPITAIWAQITTDHGDLSLPTLEAEQDGDAAVAVEHLAFDSGGKSELDGETVIGLTLTNEYLPYTSSTVTAYLRADEADAIGNALLQAAADHCEH